DWHVPHLWVELAFFFQADDGIRDRNVTGVQTCALPISNQCQPDRRYQRNQPDYPESEGRRPDGNLILREGGSLPPSPSVEGEGRSEERRVGKERRYRWARQP